MAGLITSGNRISARKAGSNGMHRWYAQADMQGPKSGHDGNVGQRLASWFRQQNACLRSVGCSATACFHSRFRAHFVALSAYAYQRCVPLLPARS